MGKEEKAKEKAKGKAGEWKKTRRGKKGKGSEFVHEHKKLLQQSTRTARLRKKGRRERAAEDPSGPVERRMVPALPENPKKGEFGVHSGVADYYRRIVPGGHPLLRLNVDTLGQQRVVAVRDIGWKEVGLRLCCVVGYLTKVEPEPHKGIKLGHGEYIDFSDVRFDLGYHALKGERYVEGNRAEPNYIHYIRCRTSDDWRTNCKLVADPAGQKVVWLVTTGFIGKGMEVMVEYDSTFFPYGKGEKVA
jgi:hypothetical protein